MKKDLPKNYAYGIYQNSDTKDYIIVLKNIFCKKCCELYTDVDHKWCQIDNLKGWTSGNEKIDCFIQEMQLMEGI